MDIMDMLASRLTYRQKRKPCIEERCIRMDIMDMLECFLIAETNLDFFCFIPAKNFKLIPLEMSLFILVR